MNNLKDMMIKLGSGNTIDRFITLCDIIKDHNLDFYLMEPIEGTFSYKTTNIIIPAKQQTDKIVVTAHYDVVLKSKGYNDNSSGLLAALIVALNNNNPNVEVVFTDREELGGGGSDLYIFNELGNIKYNINLDVCGLPNTVYVDNDVDFLNDYVKNKNFRVGKFPFCDGHIFREYGIPSISFCTGPSEQEMSFGEGISYIFKTIHNNECDNDISLISFDMIQLVANLVLDIIKNDGVC